MDNNQPNIVVVKPYRSVAVALFMALFLGPLGLIYASSVGSIILTILFAVFLLMSRALPTIFMPLMALIWIVSIFWSPLSIRRDNKKLTHYLFPGLDTKNQ